MSKKYEAFLKVSRREGLAKIDEEIESLEIDYKKFLEDSGQNFDSVTFEYLRGLEDKIRAGELRQTYGGRHPEQAAKCLARIAELDRKRVMVERLYSSASKAAEEASALSGKKTRPRLSL